MVVRPEEVENIRSTLSRQNICLADLRARVLAMEKSQDYMRAKMDSDNIREDERHRQLMEAITSNKIVSSILDSKSKTAVAVVMAVITIFLGVMGLIVTTVKTFFSHS